MTSLAIHKKHISEHLNSIEHAVLTRAADWPTTIGFHTTACACDLLELYLHRKELIDVGKVVKHDWFKRPKEGQKIIPLIERKLPVNFEGKQEVYELLYTLEEHRDTLIYGNAGERQVELVLETFQQVKGLLFQMLEEEGETLEGR